MRKCNFCNQEDKNKKPGRKNFCSNKCKILGSIRINENECWEWIKEIDIDGYGRTIDYETKKRTKVHRLSYKIFKGKIPDKLLVLHHCDNPKCCNPEHLWIGNQKENINDAMKKNRMQKMFRKGLKHWNAKLTEDQVKEIKKMYLNKMKIRRISEIFQINEGTISDICLKKTWKHL